MGTEERRLPGEGIPQTIFSLMWTVERRIRRHLRGANLHWGLRRILQRLWLEDGLSQVELAARLGSSEASVSNMLKHLVAGGWVERRKDDYDYRISRVHLTEKGTALRDAIAADLCEIDLAIRAELGPEAADRLASSLDRVKAVARRFAPCGVPDRAHEVSEHPSPPGDL